ncbi:fibronectin type III domain-containing protein [Aquimarina pacifica]|uniref:fibronectin type III domain-containing protein n=1 Tax=Aquimarina pacifica TaxID=1296415 RepID=UPI0004728E24|nr:fibronectin type III domain-containing protein [Aquimarina pacifica]
MNTKLLNPTLFITILLFLFSISGCKSDDPLEEELNDDQFDTKPSVSTIPASNITAISTSTGGTLNDDGGSEITKLGVCYSTETNPTIESEKTIDNLDGNTYKSLVTNLIPNTQYYYKAYATNAKGTSYGEELNFTTLGEDNNEQTKISTVEVTNITSSSADTGGMLSDYSGSEIIEKGVCYGTEPNLDIINNSQTYQGSGASDYTSTLSGLLADTKYYYKAYITNEDDVTTYGEELEFTTKDIIVSENTIYAPKGNDITIDGIISNEEWTDATTISLSNVGHENAELLVKYNDTHLMLAFTDVVSESAGEYLLEFFFDINKDQSEEFMSDDWYFHVSASDCQAQGDINLLYNNCKKEKDEWQANNDWTYSNDTVEVRIQLSYIDFDTSAGFGVYALWPAGVSELNPSTWGSIELIP